MSGLPFRPVQGPESKINSYPITDGHVYYVTDSGKIYLDVDGKRVPMGGTGAAIYYGQADTIEENTDKTYNFPKDMLEDITKIPKIGDLIFNIKDGKIYRIENIFNDYFNCSLVSTSGTGTAYVTKPKIDVNSEKLPSVTVNGQSIRVYFTPKSEKDSDGNLLDKTLNVSWATSYDLGNGNKGTQYNSSVAAIQVSSGEQAYFDIVLRNSISSIITLTVAGPNHDLPRSVDLPAITSSELSLSHTTRFNAATIYKKNNVIAECEVVGNLYKILTYSFDGVEIKEVSLRPTDSTSQQFTFPLYLCTHGNHTIQIDLYFNSSNNVDNPVRDKRINVTPLKYEIAVVDDSVLTPIIWLGNYKEIYYNYDTISIPFMIYNPGGNTAKVHLRINNAELESSPIDITNFSSFNYWEITNNEIGPMFCEIICGDAQRSFDLIVEQDPNRKMELSMQENLKFNFDPTGRANNESKANRQIYSNNGINMQFKNFNWHNNGWLRGSIGQTCLKISNGASISIPIGNMVFGKNEIGQKAHSFEIQFKLSNIQKYSNLIKDVTRYWIYPGGIVSESNRITDDIEYDKFLAQDIYDNYDIYLQNTLKPDEFETLKFRYVYKAINPNDIVCNFANVAVEKGVNTATGFMIGTQDTFFSNGNNTVSVAFVEDDLINLSCVYDYDLQMLFIYINGVITGVIKNTQGIFTIRDATLMITSELCDIELYKLRVYDETLDVKAICTNYAVDRKDVLTYDQLSLAIPNNVTKEYQINKKNLDDYNEAHIKSNYSMPYIIFDTSDNERNYLLPSSKSANPIYAVVDFVNVPLDRAYKNGDLEQVVKDDRLVSSNETNRDIIDAAIKKYYKYHCPSFTTQVSEMLIPRNPTGSQLAIEKIALTLQGTSSQFYPRKNFKGKSKCTTEVWNEDTQQFESTKLLNIYMNQGPYEQEYNNAVKTCSENLEEYKQNIYGKESFRLNDGWYMNNYTNGTDRWTFKVDYMESSGSYNAGFANMVAQAYTKHPLKDFLEIFSSSTKGSTVKDLLSTKATGTQELIWNDYRTSMEGFPVMAFQKRADEQYVFIGYYRMLLDKGSDEVLGFKPNEGITTKYVQTWNNEEKKYEDSKVRDIAECWEFSTNNRTYCSFKDPAQRVQLSFTPKVKETEDDPIEFTAQMAPWVADNFEYRYNSNEDYIDYLVSFSKQQADSFKTFQDIKNNFNLNYEIPDAAITDTSNPTKEDKENARKAGKFLTYFYRNWEKACQWVWSTNLDAVVSEGSYSPVLVGEAIYESGQYYIKTTQIGSSGIAEDVYNISYEAFNENEHYYRYEPTETDPTKQYVLVHLCETSENLYQPNTYYELTIVQGKNRYNLITSTTYSDTISTYYKFTSKSEEELQKVADRLMAPASGDFDIQNQYYIFNPSAKINPGNVTGAYTLVSSPSEEEFNEGKYYIPTKVTWNNKIYYKYDTVEYRSAKFVNELKNHFDLEYMATYFIMTEFFECYDSRGKNCMMASWGPKEEGGDYIWYPIFYDIDTQLGINNSGIPSFEFNVDATEANNFSTSDSILWNNFYAFFKTSAILSKYQNLKGETSSYTSLSHPPLRDIDTIEKWYEFDPNALGSKALNITCKGARPLIVTNLDMYFKYITICNSAAFDQGFGFTEADDSWATPDNGTYFYALQGDRQQSRRQFLTNRMQYIDSWLNQGEYARNGKNRIRGRIASNDIKGTRLSDHWADSSTASDYWTGKEFESSKKHKFDAEYWVKLSPIYSTYTTLGADADFVYPSQKYDGINPVNFEISEIKQGFLNAADYPEQLLYIYGMKNMRDIGNISNLYWAEFFMEGLFPKLTSLKLGYDGPNGESDPNISWYNKGLRTLSLAAMPLLKEINLSNISLTTESPIDLTSSQKLENFRALNSSNINQVDFAEAVALNTLYFPPSVRRLELVEPSLLTNLITSQKDITITEDSSGKLTATPGLYLQNFFNETGEDIYTGSSSSSINTINLSNDALGYGSYQLLKRFYNMKKDVSSTATLNMAGVNWCPYTQLTEGAIYENDKESLYYIDNGHYGFDRYTYDETSFKADVLSGKIYLDTGDFTLIYEDVDDYAYEILQKLKEPNNFTGINNRTNPYISGIIYIKNENPIKESEIYTLQNSYQDLSLFFANVEKDCYTMKFVYCDNSTGQENYVKYKDENITKPSVQRIKIEEIENAESPKFFESPFTLYNPIKSHYDLIGWSLNKNADENSDDLISSNWTGTVKQGQYDYVYYAIFKIHSYKIEFRNYDGEEIIETMHIPYNAKLVTPSTIPYRPYESDRVEDLYKAYNFLGYSTTIKGGKVDVESMTSQSDRVFYAIFSEQSDIREIVHPEWFNVITTNAIVEGYSGTPSAGKIVAKGCEISPKLGLVGKITIPRMINDIPVVRLSNFSKIPGTENSQKITHVFIQQGSGENPVYQISSGCFKEIESLVYFDFSNTNLIRIDNEGFMRCSLDISQLRLHECETLEAIALNAFTNSLTNKNNSSGIFIPYSVVLIGSSAFNYQNNVGNNLSITIGSSTKKSKLNLALPDSEISVTKFEQNNDVKISVIFYSELYSSQNDLVGNSSNTVKYYFGPTCKQLDVL